jgi:hypothetical protein
MSEKGELARLVDPTIRKWRGGYYFYKADRYRLITKDTVRALFGKYFGRFYIPQHCRGSIRQGIIAKDYRARPGGRS